MIVRGHLAEELSPIARLLGRFDDAIAGADEVTEMTEAAKHLRLLADEIDAWCSQYRHQAPRPPSLRQQQHRTDDTEGAGR